jgi:sugar/nucleoside kinase (ribokinase family)
MHRSFDILVAGEINPDLVLAGDVLPEFGQVEKLVDSAALVVGSSSAIFACGAARLGLKVAFTGVCAPDVFGRFMLDALSARGVDTSHVLLRPDGQTGLSVILNRGSDRAILTYPGLIPSLAASDISDEWLSTARHLHVASYFLQTALQPGLPGLFRRAHALGLTTSLDPNYDPAGRWLGFDKLLQCVDIFLPNAAEALSLTGRGDVESAAHSLAQQTGIAAIKLGPAGALAATGDDLCRAASLPVQVADTVGAGDSFDAGFLYGYLNNWPLERCLRLGCVCGALSTQKTGGTAAQPTLEEAMAHVPG